MRLQHPPRWLRPAARRRADGQPWRVARPPLRSRVGPDSLRHVRLTLTPALTLGARAETPGALGSLVPSAYATWRGRKAAGQKQSVDRSRNALRSDPPRRSLPGGETTETFTFDPSFLYLVKARAYARAREARIRGRFGGGEEPPESVPSAVSVSLERDDSAVRAPDGRTALDLPRPSEGRRVALVKSAMERGRFTP